MLSSLNEDIIIIIIIIMKAPHEIYSFKLINSTPCFAFYKLAFFIYDTNGSRHLLKYLSRDMTKPTNIRLVWSVFAVHVKKPWVLSYPLDSDQPGHPPSLIRVFAVRSVGS